MSYASWLRTLKSHVNFRRAKRNRRPVRKAGVRFCPTLEYLEDRCLLAYAINEFALPTPNSAPNYIAAGPDGNVWFTETNHSVLGRITPAGQITEVPLPAVVGNFIFGPDGNIWLSTSTDITEITPQGGVLHDYEIPSVLGSFAGLNIALGSDGNIWYTEPYHSNVIGRLTPDGQITEFHAPLDAAGATEIINGPDGNLWFEATDTYTIGRITPDGTITVYALPNYGTGNGVRGLTAVPYTESMPLFSA
jgi:virginiamycin B lyase